MKPIILGTRGSPLALSQARQVMTDLKKAWPGRNFEIHVIKTEGDKLAERVETEPVKLGKGLFTAELERALIEGQIDLAVHSLKDLPTCMAEGLMLAAVPKRGDAHDVLITRGADLSAATRTGFVTASGSLRRVMLGPELSFEAVIATGSPRRAAQLKNVRNDLKTVPIRGNIETRLKKFRENQEWSGIILAQAGIDRLKPDVAGLTLTKMPFAQMLPAPGQGALGLQTRTENSADVRNLVRALHDMTTAAAVAAERMFLEALGGGCGEPIGAYAEAMPDGNLRLEGIAWLIGETEPRRGEMVRPLDKPEALGVDLAVELSR
ncbi:MAG TPA: hydroxymethylbilane synthase [Candidatus Methylacidiphilales bacterium]|jgi:hydroxymethylbilane synthase|nr:hydroxymethylbilane synthase [Candidatus Methylacidiphilales bacterium]